MFSFVFIFLFCSHSQTELRKKIKEGIVDRDSLSDEERSVLRYQVGKDEALNKSFTVSAGDLFIMGGNTQTFWRHRVVRDKQVNGQRIALTFRRTARDLST